MVEVSEASGRTQFEPFLQVVICTYNRATLLGGALDPLVEQTVQSDQNWSVLVVDNNCTDDTRSVVKSFEGRLPGLRIVDEPRQGLTEARQRGFLATDAPWVAFLDDDCRPASDWIYEALQFIERRPEAAAFNGHNTLTFSDDRIRPWIHPEMFAAMNPDSDDDLTDRERPEGLHGAGLVLRRDAVVRSGWLDEPRAADRRGNSLVSGGDNELALRAGAGGDGGGLWFVSRCRLQHLIDADRLRFTYLARLNFRLAESRPLIAAITWPESKQGWRRRAGLSLAAGLARAASGRRARAGRLIGVDGRIAFSARARAVMLGWCEAVGFAVGYLRLAPNPGGILDQVLGLAVAGRADGPHREKAQASAEAKR